MCVYHVYIHIGRPVSLTEFIVPPARFAESEKRNGRFKLPRSFIPSWFVFISRQYFYHGLFVAYACALYRVLQTR